MIDILIKTIEKYMSEYNEDPSLSENEEMEHSSVDGKTVSQDTRLMKEMIKIKNYFANVYATSVKSKDFDLVDKLVYDYSNMVESAYYEQSIEGITTLEGMTVVINLLLGMEVNYPSLLRGMIESNQMPMIISYFQESYDKEIINGYDLYEYITTTNELSRSNNPPKRKK